MIIPGGILTKKECDAIAVAHTLHDIVDPEITEPRIWEVTYAIPFELLEQYCPLVHV
ncbi:hypothetical protein [Desulfobacter vibrioformis]|uniref:hypothetical protein n=1 Tax=Desulfobacter vibrioformis TaxID=34031 RepID=UPI0012EC170E|nr:hypothetical protein [Desulfobacter vibrioformis]